MLQRMGQSIDKLPQLTAEMGHSRVAHVKWRRGWCDIDFMLCRETGSYVRIESAPQSFGGAWSSLNSSSI